MKGEIQMKRLGWLFLAGALVAGTAQAGDFDGSKKLICAPAVAMDCAVADECIRGMPDDMGAPTFIRIDFDKKEVKGTNNTSPVLHMEKSPEQVLLLGVEVGLGWTIAIDSETGQMHATLAGKDGAFVLIGFCTPL